MRLSIGSNGSDVLKAQTCLVRKTGLQLVLDGVFGPKTEAAVEQFQSSTGTLVVDGIIGDQTWGALVGDSAQPPANSVEATTPPVPPPQNAATTIRRLPPLGDTVPGIDISSYQPTVNWDQVVADGYKFVFIKVFEYVEDGTFAKHWADAGAAGLMRGAYDYFHPANDPIAQAQNSAKAVGQMGPGDLGIWLDWETTDGLSPGADLSSGLLWLQECQKITTVPGGVYGGAYFFQSLAPTFSQISQIAKYPLWLADYGASNVAPRVPSGWSKFTFWQQSGTANVPGIGGQMDTNIFNGSLSDLQALAGLAIGSST